MDNDAEYTEYVNHVGAYVEVLEQHNFSTEYMNVLIGIAPMPELCEYLAMQVVQTGIHSDLEAIVTTNGVVTVDNKKITNMLETLAIWLVLRKYVSVVPDVMDVFNYIPDPESIDYPDFDEESITAEPIADEDRELFLLE